MPNRNLMPHRMAAKPLENAPTEFNRVSCEWGQLVVRSPCNDLDPGLQLGMEGHRNIDRDNSQSVPLELIPKRLTVQPILTDAAQLHLRAVPLQMVVDAVFAGRPLRVERGPHRSR